MPPTRPSRGLAAGRRATTPPSATTPESLPERILNTAEALIRRYGPAKATVLDVARALGMSHGNVYRHFASKAALREAVVERWLAAVRAEVTAATPAGGPAGERLRTWVRALAAAKRGRLQDDPELFAAYAALGDEQQGAVIRYLQTLVDDLAAVIADGVQAGAFAPRNAPRSALAVLDATSAFHNPHRVPDTAADPDGPARLEAVLDLLVAGLTATGRASRPDSPHPPPRPAGRAKAAAVGHRTQAPEAPADARPRYGLSRA